MCLEEWETDLKVNRISTASFIVLNSVRSLGKSFALNTSENKM